MSALKWVNFALGAACAAVWVSAQPDPSQFEQAIGWVGALNLALGLGLHVMARQES